MFIPKCSVCERTLERLGGESPVFKNAENMPGRGKPLDQWRGNVCGKCSYIFCPFCLSVWPPPKCPVCKSPVQPAMNSYIKGIKPRKLTVEAEGGTLKEAQDKASARIPDGFSLLAWDIISDGEDKIVEGAGETPDCAMVEAEKKMPVSGEFKDKSVLRGCETNKLIVRAFSETEAITKAREQARAPVVIQSVLLTKTPFKGIMGFGEKPGIYSINVTQLAVVKIIYKTRAKVRAVIRRSQK